MSTIKEIIERAESCGATVEKKMGLGSGVWWSVVFPGVGGSYSLYFGHANTHDIGRIEYHCSRIERERELGYEKPGVGSLMREVAKELAERIEQAKRDAASRLTLHSKGDVICNGQHYGPITEINVLDKDALPSIQYVFLGEDGNEHEVIYYNAMPYNTQP
jgi:hypothetical protein